MKGEFKSLYSNRAKKLLSNIGIFAIGNLGSKLINFILIPIFTRYMSTASFGHVDLITTTINMLQPVIALSIADAIFRFVMDKNSDYSTIMTTGLFFTFGMILLSFLAVPILEILNVEFPIYIMFYLALVLLQSLLQNFVRGVGYVKLFAINGLLTTVVLASVGVIRIVVQRGGVQGYLDALVLSNLFSVFFLGFSAQVWRFVSLKKYQKSVLIKMLRYSVPLIPNAFLWFFTNDASRYFILAFLGVAANGIYAVATKVPTIINVFYSVFTQAWQISAVEEYERNRDGSFFSTVFNANVGLSVILIGGIIVVLKPLMTVFVATDYFVAWKVVPALLLAAFFSNLSGFLGTIYLATKQTVGIMKTTVYGMLINIVLNFILVPLLGLQGAGIGAALGFAFVMLIRLRDVQKFVRIVVNKLEFIISVGLIMLMITLQLSLGGHQIFLYSLLIALELSLILVNLKQFNLKRPK